jgi:hypothetical protein
MFQYMALVDVLHFDNDWPQVEEHTTLQHQTLSGIAFGQVLTVSNHDQQQL